MNFLAVLIGLTLISCCTCATQWVDMSYSYDSKTNYFPGHTRLKHTPVQSKMAPVGFSYYDILMSEHGGTHIDAPKHFYQKGKHLNEVLLDELIGPAVVVDISVHTAKDQDYQLSVGDLEAWEEKHGKIPDGAILFLYSGRGKDWANPDKFLGYDPKLNKTGYGYLHNPGNAKIEKHQTFVLFLYFHFILHWDHKESTWGLAMFHLTLNDMSPMQLERITEERNGNPKAKKTCAPRKLVLVKSMFKFPVKVKKECCLRIC